MQVHPGTAETGGRFPPWRASHAVDGDDMCFVPRFAFMDGTPYAVSVGGVTVAVLLRPAHTFVQRPRCSRFIPGRRTSRATSCASMWCSPDR